MSNERQFTNIPISMKVTCIRLSSWNIQHMKVSFFFDIQIRFPVFFCWFYIGLTWILNKYVFFWAYVVDFHMCIECKSKCSCIFCFTKWLISAAKLQCIIYRSWFMGWNAISSIFANGKFNKLGHTFMTKHIVPAINYRYQVQVCISKKTNSKTVNKKR